MKRLGIASFTERGGLLADRLTAEFGDEYEIVRCEKGRRQKDGCSVPTSLSCPDEIREKEAGPGGLKTWCGELFALGADGILFVGACGIAVRTIAPFLKSKTADPAVVVLDEAGTYAISLLSGHLGGANRLAYRAAKAVGAKPVITTATDVNGKFAVDVFAKDNDLVIGSMQAAKEVSAAVLRGEPVGLYSEIPVLGKIPPELTLLEISREQIALAFPVPGTKPIVNSVASEAGAVQIPRVLIYISETPLYDSTQAFAQSTESSRNFAGSTKRRQKSTESAEKIRKLPENTENSEKSYPSIEAPLKPAESTGDTQKFTAAIPAADSNVNTRDMSGRTPVILWLRPKALTLGIGCRRGKTPEEIGTFVANVLARAKLSPELLAGAASIDLKKEEAGLLSFCSEKDLSLTTYSADELMEVSGDITPSGFVRSVTGADNVCERAALRLAGPGGKLIVKKQADNGVTAAVAKKNCSVRF